MICGTRGPEISPIGNGGRSRQLYDLRVPPGNRLARYRGTHDGLCQGLTMAPNLMARRRQMGAFR